MGCDGGTIPRRDELVRLKKKPEQKDKDSELSFRWRHCAVSQQPLQTPIVACGLGRLYSKSSLLESLLDKFSMPESSRHVRTLRDIKDLNLTENPAYDPDSARSAAPHICPVTGLEMSGRFRFVFLWSCGCVFSERALKAINSHLCLKCQKPFADQDVVVLNGTDEDLALMKLRLDNRNAEAKSKKKAKKCEKTDIASTIVKPSEETKVNNINIKTEQADAVQKLVDDMPKQVDAVHKLVDDMRMPKHVDAKPMLVDVKPNLPSTSSKNIKPVTASVKLITGSIKIQEKAIKRSANQQKMSDPAFKKSKDEYSVAQDPKATDVFKSLFTSHNNAVTQDRAHWITYNPFYN